MPETNALSEMETAFVQIPDVRAARLVADDQGKLVEVHIVSRGEKPAKQVVRDVQTSSLALFGIDIDHRIVSVVQFPDGKQVRPEVARERITLMGISTETRGDNTRVAVSLGLDGKTATGESSGATTFESIQRSSAVATLDAVAGLHLETPWISLESVGIQKIAGKEVAFVTLTYGAGSLAQLLSGSAVVGVPESQSIVRAVLDALNRRIHSRP